MTNKQQVAIASPRQLIKLAQWKNFKLIQDDWFEGCCMDTQRAVVATAAGLELGLTPLWLNVLAPSSTGKTKMYVEPVLGAEHAEKTGQLFISGLLTSVKGKSAGLLAKHNVKWLWVEPELSNLTAMDKKQLPDMLAAMRDLYDMNYRRDFKHAHLVHKGRVNFIGAGTNAFDRAISVHRAMGERLVSIRPQPCVSRAVGSKVQKQGGVELMMANQQHEAVNAILSALVKPTIPTVYEDCIWNLARAITKCRPLVDRGYQDTIRDIHEAEGPGRLHGIFIAFALADAATHGLDEVGEEQLALVHRIAFETLYLRRGQVLRVWAIDPTARIKQADVREMSSIKWPSAFKYVLDELNALGIVFAEEGSNNITYLRLSEEIAEFLSLSMVRPSVSC